MMILFFIV